MKTFKCWYLLKNYGWIIFKKDFKNEKEALNYCEKKTDFKGSSIVEEIETEEGRKYAN